MKKKNITISGVPRPETHSVELTLLAALYDTPEYMRDCADVLAASDFEDLRPLYEKLSSQVTTAGTIDILTLTDDSHFSDMMAETQGCPRIYSEINHSVALLKELAAKRRVYDAALRTEEAFYGGASAADLLAINKALMDEIEAAAVRSTESPFSELMDDLGKRFEALQKGEKPGVVPSGFYKLDNELRGGFANGELCIIAARPSVGKTAFSLICAKQAAKEGNPVLYISLEMTKDELIKRAYVGETYQRPDDLDAGVIDWDEFSRVNAILHPLPLYIDDAAASLYEIEQRANKAVLKHGIKAVYIDYLGLIDMRNDGRRIYEKVVDITRSLKLMAKRLNIPVVLLCQLNRDSDKEKRVPQLRDLRDSGSIEQDADKVLMLHRKINPEAAVDEDLTREPLYCFVRKNRGGRVGKFVVFTPNESVTALREQ